MTEPVSVGRRATGPLTAARIFEQAALAALLVVLARRLSVASFGEASLAIAFQAVAVTASDLGVGLALLRIPDGVPVDELPWRRARRINRGILGGAAVAAIAGLALGPAATLVAVAAAVWWSSALAFIAKAAALRAHHPGAVARTEVVSSATFLALALILVTDDSAFVTLSGAFIVRNLIESAVLGGWTRAAFASSGEPLRARWVWVTQVMSYVTSNVDYLVVGLALGPVQLGVYSLAYRAASFVPSQISFVVNRVAIVSLAEQAGADRWTEARSLVRRLFLFGAAVALGAFVVAPVVPEVLGERWEPSVDVILVLLVGVPWRLVLPVAGILALVDDKARELARWEAARMGLTVVALGIGSLGGITGLAVAATVVPIAATFMLFAAVGPQPNIARSGSLVYGAVASCASVALIAIAV